MALLELKVERYTASNREAWDAFVARSKNGTFLFERGYLEYHADRFTDCSLIIRRDTEIAALLPASSNGRVITSHGGLTYGGLITDESMTIPGMVAAFEAMLTWCAGEGSFERLVYKAVPSPYHRLPAEEDLVVLFLLQAALVRRSALSIAELANRLPFQERRRRGVKKAIASGVTVAESTHLEAYWQLLTQVLHEHHGAKPVHSLEEIVTLKGLFPQRIRLFEARRGETLLAGVLVYESEQVARAQYIASSDEGRQLGALDLTFNVLLGETFAKKRSFDFGTSELNGGRTISQGLIEQKEGFGARAVAQDTYQVELNAWQPGSLNAALTGR